MTRVLLVLLVGIAAATALPPAVAASADPFGMTAIVVVQEQDLPRVDRGGGLV
jgi:hypothetical protein